MRLVLAEMKKALYLAFSAYGRVLDVVVCKTAKLRGQAWVVYENVPCSTNALRGLQGLPFYDRELVSRAPQPLCPHWLSARPKRGGLSDLQSPVSARRAPHALP